MTGGAGAVGTRLLPALSEAGWRTRALAHRRPISSANELAWGSLEDAPSLLAAACGAEGVVHLAARTHARMGRGYERTNVEGTARLLAAAQRAGVERFVHVSTRAVSERGGAYSRSKLRSEQLVRGTGLTHVIVRLPEVYGAGAREGVDGMLAQARHGAPIFVVGGGLDVLCPIHVDDAVSALVAALSSPAARGSTYTLAGECYSARDVARACANACGRTSRIVSIPAPAVAVASLAARILPLPLYPDQLARLRATKPARSPESVTDLGFSPRSLEAGLRAAVRTGAM